MKPGEEDINPSHFLILLMNRLSQRTFDFVIYPKSLRFLPKKILYYFLLLVFSVIKLKILIILTFSESGSTLKKFLEESVSMSPEERAKYLENYDVSTFFLS